MVDLEARLIRIERVIENQSLIQLASEVDMLRSEAMQLRGEIETLRYETENSNKRQRDLYVDVDRRLQSIEQGQQPALAPAPPPAAAPPSTLTPHERAAEPPAGERAVASRAAAARARPARISRTTRPRSSSMQGRKYEEAGRAFAQFLAAFPQSPLADNAQYWLAETQYVRGQYQPALAEFQKVMDQYPQSAKLPDALLKVGLLPGRARQPRSGAHRAAAGDAPVPRHDGRAARVAAARASVAIASATLRAHRNGGRGGARGREPAAQDHRDLLLDPGRGRVQRLAHGVRASHGLPAALPVLRHRVRVHGRRVALVRARSRREIRKHGTRYVCVTGGEPLAQPRCTALLTALCDAGFDVSLETSGAHDIAPVDTRVCRVVDVKTPGSREAQRNRWENLALLTPHDALKFVICDRADYEWSRGVLAERFAGGARAVPRVLLAELRAGGRGRARGLDSRGPVARALQVQLHKVLWGNVPGR